MILSLYNPGVAPEDFTVRAGSGEDTSWPAGTCHMPLSLKPIALSGTFLQDRLPCMIPSLCNPGVGPEGFEGGGVCVLAHRHLLSVPPKPPAAALSGTSPPKRGGPTHVPLPCLHPEGVLKGSLCRLGALVGASYLA